MCFETVKNLPFGRIMRVKGKHKTTLFCVWHSKRMRDLFPKIAIEQTHWSDIVYLETDMRRANEGFYNQFALSVFIDAVKPVPHSTLRF